MLYWWIIQNETYSYTTYVKIKNYILKTFLNLTQNICFVLKLLTVLKLFLRLSLDYLNLNMRPICHMTLQVVSNSCSIMRILLKNEKSIENTTMQHWGVFKYNQLSWSIFKIINCRRMKLIILTSLRMFSIFLSENNKTCES